MEEQRRIIHLVAQLARPAVSLPHLRGPVAFDRGQRREKGDLQVQLLPVALGSRQAGFQQIQALVKCTSASSLAERRTALSPAWCR